MIWRLSRRRPSPEVVQWASLYRRGDDLFIASSSRNLDGFNQDTPPYSRVGILDGERALGAAIIEALDASRDGVANPWRDPAHRAGHGENQWPILKLAGVESHKAFMQGARFADVKREADVITFTPWHNNGDSFVPLLNEPTLQADAADPAHVGAQALAALDRAE